MEPAWTPWSPGAGWDTTGSWWASRSGGSEAEGGGAAQWRQGPSWWGSSWIPAHGYELEPQFAESWDIAGAATGRPERPEAARLLAEMEKCSASFVVWEKRYDPDSQRTRTMRNELPDHPQPCEPCKGVLLGDFDDARALSVLVAKDVATVWVLCPEQVEATDMDVLVQGHRKAGIEVKVLFALDQYDYDILQHLDVLSSSVAENLRKHNKTLVCCWAGVNRSVALVMGYMLSRGAPLVAVWKSILSQRGMVLTNMHFRQLLVDYSMALEAGNMPMLLQGANDAIDGGRAVPPPPDSDSD
jgi:hypothetical protein